MGHTFLDWWRNAACSFCRNVRNILVTFSSVIIFCFSVFGAVTVYEWAIDEAPAVEFGEGSVSAPSAQPSDTISFFQPTKKLRDCPGRILQILNGDCGYHVMHNDEAALVQGFEGRVNYVLRVPFEALPGRCEFRVKARYACNPFDWFLQRQVFESAPIPFSVLPFREQP